jgi:hypothetical protein
MQSSDVKTKVPVVNETLNRRKAGSRLLAC